MDTTFNKQSISLEGKLLNAIFEDDLPKVEKLLSEGAAVNTKGTVSVKNFDDYTVYTPLTLAAEKGNADLVERLLSCPEIAVNYGDYYGHTALHKATECGHVEVLKLLLAAKDIDVNVEDNKMGYTPLHLVGGDGAEILEMLLRVPEILVNKKDKLGKTALHYLARLGHAEEVGILFNAPGVLVNEKDDDNDHTPLHLAADFHHVDVVEELLKHPDIDVNVKDKYGQTALHTSSYHGNLKLVEMLLEAGIDVKEKAHSGHTAGYYAAKQKRANVLEAIVNDIKKSKERVDLSRGTVNKQMDDITKRIIFSEHRQKLLNNVNAALLAASKAGDLSEVLSLLKKPSIDVNFKHKYKGNTALHFAAENGHLEVVQELMGLENLDVNAKNKDTTRFQYPVKKGDNPERYKLDIGKTALYLAVDKRHLDVVKVLLDHPKIDVNAGDKYDTRPIHLALYKGPLDIAKLLLKHPKIDVGVKDLRTDYYTPLHIASKNGYEEIVKMLLNRPEIDVNAKENFRQLTPLRFAIEKRNLEIVEALLKRPKIEVNATDGYDETPLYLAAKMGHSGILMSLIKANARIDVGGIRRKTPLDIARENKHHECVKILSNFM